MDQYIKSFEIISLWDRMDVRWNDIHQDVNVLVGINGAGKTTLLNTMYNYYHSSLPKELRNSVNGNTVSTPVSFIKSFDIPSESKKKVSPLLVDLERVVLQNKDNDSLFNYRMRSINYPEEAERVQARMAHLFSIANDFFSETGKTLEIDKNTNLLVFRLMDKSVISMDKLSAGEKQLLLILITVFLQDEKPYILLMDEPELSLHISWQDKLISTLRELNPNCQLIISTHSPSIFANGWESQLVFMDEITSSNNNV